MANETEKLDPRPLVLKRLVWDIFPHDTELVREVQLALGLVPDGEDGLEMEHDASDTRINRVAPLTTTLKTLSTLSAEVISHYIVGCLIAESDEVVELPEGFHESLARQNTEVIYDASYAIIAHLMDTGVLGYGEKVKRA